MSQNNEYFYFNINTKMKEQQSIYPYLLTFTFIILAGSRPKSYPALATEGQRGNFSTTVVIRVIIFTNISV